MEGVHKEQGSLKDYCLASDFEAVVDCFIELIQPYRTAPLQAQEIVHGIDAAPYCAGLAVRKEELLALLARYCSGVPEAGAPKRFSIRTRALLSLLAGVLC